MSTEFRLLGPLEIRRGGEPLELRARKPRALVAMLLLHANEVVSTDGLTGALWGERLAREAIEFAAASDFLDSHAGALLDLATILTAAGRQAEAVPLTRQAARLYEAKGNVLAVAHVHALTA